jgi:hypothetical protein
MPQVLCRCFDEKVEHVVGPEPPRDDNNQTSAAELIDHDQHAERPRPVGSQAGARC